jgi:hypothetical protein
MIDSNAAGSLAHMAGRARSCNLVKRYAQPKAGSGWVFMTAIPRRPSGHPT